MRLIRLAPLPMLGFVVLVGCSRDPNVVKHRYLESGNRYFAKGKYKEAAIMYKDALQKDLLFGPAHYKLALTSLKLGQATAAVTEFRKAIDTIPQTDSDHWDSMVKLSEIYLAVRQKQYLEDVDTYTKQLLARDANSFDAYRLMGDLNFVRAQQAYATANRDEGKKELDTALAEYRKADSVKSGQQAVLLQIARVDVAEQNYAEAASLYQQVIDKDKTLETAYTELYRLYMYQQKTDDGERVLKLAFQNNPKQYAFLTALAMHYSLLKRRDDMVNVLQQIKTHAKDYPQAYLKVGDFYFRLGDPDSAVREYKEGITKDAKQKATYQKRIIEVYMRQGKRSDAADINQQILKDNPNDTDAKGLEATLLLDKGDILRAMTELQAVVNRAPDNPIAHFQLGRAHAARGEYAQARQQFDKALELQPNNIQARLALAQLEVTQGQYDAALTSAQQVIQVDRSNTAARLIQSAALMGEKKFPESRALLNSMLKVAPNSPAVLFQLGVVNLSENKYKDAEEDFRKAYDLNPASTRGLMGIVETDMAQNKADAALALLESESVKAPNKLDLKVAIGNTAVRAGKYDLAIQAYNSVLDALDKNAKQRGDVYLRLGETYRRRGDFNNAVNSLKQARDVLPDNVVVLSTLALVLDSTGRWEEAKKVYDASLKIKTDDPVVLNNDAFIMAEHGGDLDQALTMAVKAKQLLPNLSEVSDTLGWIYLKKQMSQQAIDIFKDLVQKDPQASTYRYHLGMALYQRGDSPHAAEELQAALKYNPSPNEKQKIQELLARVGGGITPSR
ncbi:MAG TPA: tetratricopeptide repeat protein [Bryobacteraceae bacterium]|nr:tetratricopeptide repeat protein [Bryobacteraceae bacterium]